MVMDKLGILRKFGFALILIVMTACGASTQAATKIAVTAPPTETAVRLVTPTSPPTAPAIDLPTVNYTDLSIYKKAMKPGFESDVDNESNANRYLIVAHLTTDADAIIQGAQRVRYTNQSGDSLSQIVYRLYANLAGLGGKMLVSNITAGGQAVDPVFSGESTIMTLPLPKPLLPGDSIEMTMDFVTVMPQGFNSSFGRFGYIHGVVNGSAWYPTLSVYEKGKGWWQSINRYLSISDPAYTEIGLYDVRLTLPSDFIVAMSGIEVDKTTNTDGTTTHRYVTGPMRDQCFMASKRFAVKSADQDGTTINVLSYADNLAKPGDGTNDVMKFAKLSIKTFDSTFGMYPYREYDVVENPATGGVEFPGIVQIGEEFWISGNSFLETVVAHETGHQWFYAMVGNNQVEHPWIDESLTSYTEIVYMRAAYPDGDKATKYAAAFQNRYTTYVALGQPDQTLDLPVGDYHGFSYELIVYTKGPVFLLELERELGRDTVYKALSTYFQREKYKVAFSPDVKQAFEDVSGQDLTDVFHKWVGL